MNSHSPYFQPIGSLKRLRDELAGTLVHTTDATEAERLRGEIAEATAALARVRLLATRNEPVPTGTPPPGGPNWLKRQPVHHRPTTEATTRG